MAIYHIKNKKELEEMLANQLSNRLYEEDGDLHICKVCHEYVPKGRFTAHAEHHIRQTQTILKLLERKELVLPSKK